MRSNSIDVAIRTRDLEPGSTITMRQPAETDRILAATPHYLRRHGVPRTPADLLEHRILVYTYATSPKELRFSRRGETATITLKNLLEANDSQFLRVAALKHMGIIRQPTYVLHDWSMARLAINLDFPNRKYRSAKVKSFVDCITAYFERKQYGQIWTAP